MRHPALLLSLALLSSTALAWVPKLDETTAKTVIDSAYDRLDNPVSTLLTVDLGVKDGKFASDGAVRAFSGGDACVQNWLASPTDFVKFGSRPTAIVMTGGADDVFLAAQAARDEFRNFTAKDALALPGRLADGQLRVYVTMNGLGSQRQRDAYNVALRVPTSSASTSATATATTSTTQSGNTTTSTTTVSVQPTASSTATKTIRPARRAFTNDWKQTNGRWGGTMLYTFDVSSAGVDPNAKVELIIKTEADNDCAYVVTADLSKFY